MVQHDPLKLSNDSRIAVIGGGPAGSFFSYFVLAMAQRAGIDLHVDIFEPRDFDTPGPRGCNMCAGVLHESLVQSLVTEGIALPATVVQRGLDSNVLHTDVGVIRMKAPCQEKRIATTFRGMGPRDAQERHVQGLDGYLLKLAVQKGATRIQDRVAEIEWVNDAKNSAATEKRLRVTPRAGAPVEYDLVAVTAGINTSLLKQFKLLGLPYDPPGTTKTYVREYYLGAETVSQYLGSAMHAFLLDIPRLDFGALVPKGAYVTLVLLGQDIDEDVVERFMDERAVKQRLPPGLAANEFTCSCSPRINVHASTRLYGDRIVFVGDCGVTRLYKDGIGSAYRAAKVAARTVVFEGVSAEDFRRHYAPFSRAVARDNKIGKLLFAIVRQIRRIRPARLAILRMVQVEQRRKASAIRGMSMVLWDMFTGSAAYGDIFLRTLHPIFWLRFLWNIAISLFAAGRDDNAKSEATPSSSGQFAASGILTKEDAVRLGVLGKEYSDGEVIIRQGDVGNSMFVVQEGQVEIVEEVGGKSVRLAVRKKGDSFGEMSIFEHQVRCATVRALGRARVLTVDEQTFLRRLHQDPSVAYRIMTTMSNRIRELSSEMAELKNSAPDSYAVTKRGSRT